MRAVVHDRYGPPDVLRLADVEKPMPKEDEILIRIRATTVNRSNCGWRAPHPFLLEDAVEATQYVETGQKTGNVALTV